MLCLVSALGILKPTALHWIVIFIPQRSSCTPPADFGNIFDSVDCVCVRTLPVLQRCFIDIVWDVCELHLQAKWIIDAAKAYFRVWICVCVREGGESEKGCKKDTIWEWVCVSNNQYVCLLRWIFFYQCKLSLVLVLVYWRGHSDLFPLICLRNSWQCTGPLKLPEGEQNQIMKRTN